jgi:hypothetical protein
MPTQLQLKALDRPDAPFSAEEVLHDLANALAVTLSCLDLIASEDRLPADLLPDFAEACSATRQAVHLLPLLRRCASRG